MAERKEALVEIAREMQPCTVRQVFYQATVRHLVEKTEGGYERVQRALADLRNDCAMPWSWIVDNTRWMRKPRTWDRMQDAVEHTARTYRRSLWANSGVYVEVWLEKDALAGVVVPVTDQYDVPLMVSRGYSSLTFLHASARYIRDLDRPAVIYHLGDFDPSGRDAAKKIEATLRRFAPDAEIEFEEIAVVPWQIKGWNLPGRLTKTTDSRSKNWEAGDSVELDAIDANRLRYLVESAILQHVDLDELAVVRAAEQSEREHLKTWAQMFGG